MKARFVPTLRQLGFKGSLPHFRRQRVDRVDLLTVTFDRHDGGFVAQLSQCGAEGGDRWPHSFGQSSGIFKLSVRDGHAADLIAGRL
ncbi:DUF4304 domain-containing protein [Paraburkholderia hospita]|uniref:DUF4304 domain-containing protein n=1 Tax=Paraburkholderia hospita TaxID=169430 RepID=UPI0031342D07